jgi:hypothetical protein
MSREARAVEMRKRMGRRGTKGGECIVDGGGGGGVVTLLCGDRLVWWWFLWKFVVLGCL